MGKTVVRYLIIFSDGIIAEYDSALSVNECWRIAPIRWWENLNDFYQWSLKNG